MRIRNEPWAHILGNLIDHCTFELDSNYFTSDSIKRVDVTEGQLECRYTNICMPEHDKYFEMPIIVNFKQGTGWEDRPLKIIHEMNMVGRGRWDSYPIVVKKEVFE